MNEGAVLVPAVIGALKEARGAVAASQKKRIKAIPGAADLRRPAYVKAIEGRRWASLESQGLREFKARQKARGRLMKDVVQLVRAADLVTGVMPGAQIAKQATALPQERLEAIRLHLSSDGLPPDTVNAFVEGLAAANLLDTARSVHEHIRDELLAVDLIAQTDLRATVGALLALWVAALNLAEPTTDGPAAVRAWTRSTSSSLERVEKKVHAALADGDLPAAAAWAAELGGTARRALWGPAFGSAAALSRAAANRSAAETTAAIDAGETFRACLLAMVISLRLTWLLRYPQSFPALSVWLRAASSKPFDADAPTAPKVSVKGLLQSPDQHDGRLVSVEGELGPVSIEHRGAKVVSSAEVRDQRGRAITLVVPHIKLDSGGMARGAALRATGTWHSTSPELPGPALHLDRINYSEEAAGSFRGWAEKELRRFYERRPHGLNAHWSWELGLDGAGNQLRYGNWYGG